ncbi:hypothetical protein SAMN04488587_0592 [Methanococcoides vulcani]|uniref:Uncharacterized protein n=1 Tax=Methanococcoides vulcani TaxID=1353158 RepID=A0A1H9YIH5_9EURY|nr:hypothetical protein [Methanococcoides vulcani]SES68856.1 hypothetical protein SAMN04488587_0592 [Methanococcoides vulcani]
MKHRKIALIAAFTAGMIVIAVTLLNPVLSEKVLYHEGFEEDYGIADSPMLTHADGTLCLDTGEPMNMNGGEWSKNVTLQPAKISWHWSGEDLSGFQLWMKLTFNNHKSICYVASGSMNPLSQGEFYRDEENRMRFSPSVVISGIPMNSVKRDVREDYEKYCGSFGDVEIVRISVGMKDESPEYRNMLNISDIMIYT